MAKIARAYAATEQSPDAFKPYLLGIVRGQDPQSLLHVVGSALDPSAVEDDLHEIELLAPSELGPPNLVVVKIRLFADHVGMPTPYVVVGERL